MSTNDTDYLAGQCVVYDDFASGGGNVGGQRGGVWRPPLAVVLSWFGHGQCEVTILGRGRQGAYGVRVWGSVDGKKHGHVLDIVDVDDLLEYNGQTPAVQADSEDSGRKSKLADDRGSLEKHNWLAVKGQVLWQ